MVRVEEYDVWNPRIYVAHRSKIRCAKKMVQKDVNPLFKLPRLPASAIKELAEELSEFELPAIQLDAEVTDEFHPQNSEIRHRGKDQRSSISSDSPVVPQIFSNSSIAASSENSQDSFLKSFMQSPGSDQSSNSNPEQLFQNHFQVEDELIDEMLRESPDEGEEVTGSAANLIPELEPEKTTEPEESVTEINVEPGRRGDDPAGINTPTRRQEEQETKRGEEIPEVINSPPLNRSLIQRTPVPMMKLGLLDGSKASEDTRRRSSRVSVPTDRYCAEFKLPKNPRSRKTAKSTVAPSLKSLKVALKESWAQRPDTTAPLRRRSRSRESASSTRTRAASLERVQTGSIETNSSSRSSASKCGR